MTPRIPLIAVAALLAGVLTARPAAAASIPGAQLTYTGGTVTVESLPVTSAFVSELRLYNSSFESLAFLTLDEPQGVTVTFDPGALGIAVGQELIFGIRVVSDANREYFMGPGSRNPDGAMHAEVDSLGDGEFIVGFEDLFGGGDWDYDDNRFRFLGGVHVEQIPEPGVLGLLALGVGSLIRRRFRRPRR